MGVLGPKNYTSSIAPNGKIYTRAHIAGSRTAVMVFLLVVAIMAVPYITIPVLAIALIVRLLNRKKN